MQGLNLEILKTFFCEFSLSQGCGIYVFVGIRTIILGNTFHYLKFQGIKNYI